MELYEYERLDDLKRDGLFIIQDTRGFCFGTDAVLLADFASVSKNDTVLDFCTGSGIIPLLIYAKCKTAKISGIEIINDVAAMAKRSVEYNKIGCIDILQGDLKDAAKIFGYEKFDLVTCNPPYEKVGSGAESPKDVKAAARHEIFCTLDDVIKNAFDVLKYGGKLCMVHRANRLTDVFYTMRKYSIEPKRLRLIAPAEGKEPNLFLVEGAKGGGPFMKIMPTLYVYGKDGEYSGEILRIYERGKQEQ
ncbi:MAG: tRNA1(Val) (adenine(37)-N6)-methyltransferase [Clostridia bacterium]|nr:tRNA1(Val) (adenine(37)-N6)-methyltransferase [Clostridia bacterium]